MPKNPVQADEQMFLHMFYLFVCAAKLDKCFLAKELCLKTMIMPDFQQVNFFMCRAAKKNLIRIIAQYTSLSKSRFFRNSLLKCSIVDGFSCLLEAALNKN